MIYILGINRHLLAQEDPLLIGNNFLKYNQYDEAIKAYDDGLSKDPSNNTLLLNKALVLYYKQDYNDSLNILNNLINKNKDNKKALYYKAIILFETSDLNSSLNTVIDLLKIDPEYGPAKSLKCSIFNEAGLVNQLDDCIKSLKK